MPVLHFLHCCCFLSFYVNKCGALETYSKSCQTSKTYIIAPIASGCQLWTILQKFRFTCLTQGFGYASVNGRGFFVGILSTYYKVFDVLCESCFEEFVGNKAEGRYEVVKNVRFSENLACSAFLLPQFWDSPFCLVSDELFVKRVLVVMTSKVKSCYQKCQKCQAKLHQSAFFRINFVK